MEIPISSKGFFFFFFTDKQRYTGSDQYLGRGGYSGGAGVSGKKNKIDGPEDFFFFICWHKLTSNQCSGENKNKRKTKKSQWEDA